MTKLLSGRNMFIGRLAPVLKTELGVAGLVAKAQAAALTGSGNIAERQSVFEIVESDV